MDELDKKLDFILKSNAAVQVFFDKDSMSDYDKLIPAIKQAFTESGQWVQVNASQETQAAIANTMLGNKVMTGQELYNRFEKELPPIKPGELPTVAGMFRMCRDAVKRAAGLEDKL